MSAGQRYRPREGDEAPCHDRTIGFDPFDFEKGHAAAESKQGPDQLSARHTQAKGREWLLPVKIT